MMQVKELIERLKMCPPDMRVIAPGYEDDFDDVTEIVEVPIKPDANTNWFYGRHAEVLSDQSGSERAILLKTNRRHG